MESLAATVFTVPTEDGRDGRASRRLYHRAQRDSVMPSIVARLLGRTNRLLQLTDSERSAHVHTQRYIGTQTVELARIRGSEGRADEFDAGFRPLGSNTAYRWQSIATARYADISLPEIELILMGNTYYVRDGHHRVSVAMALGELYIEARVTVWEVAGCGAGTERTPTGQSNPVRVQRSSAPGSIPPSPSTC